MTNRQNVDNKQTDNKFIATSWRKQPEHQGGFLLDGGVHFTAALRILLGEDNPIESLVAYSTCQLERLAPVDTVHATLRTTGRGDGKAGTGALGSFVMTFAGGASYDVWDFVVVCERGSVTATGTKVVVTERVPSAAAAAEDTDSSSGGKKPRVWEREFERTTGVKEEVKAWAEAITSGRRPDARLDPEEALADLELVEAMLESGAARGSQQTLSHQRRP